MEKDSLVVDVGGGIGSTTRVFAKAFPHLRFVIQDRSAVVAEGIQVMLCTPSDHSSFNVGDTL